MLRERKSSQQSEYEIVLLDELVPQDHILRKIDAAVDFSFIHELCKDLYCPDNGRPAVSPELLFKMLLLGYLYGIPSETKLAQEVNENFVFKWFLGLKLTEKGPDHATISINRVRRFRDNNIAEQIFNEILRQCVARGLVGGKIFYTDSTHIKAKANKHKKTLVTVETTPKEYMEELDAQIDLDREILNKKPFDRDDDPPYGGETTTRMQSTTDPDSGQQTREGKPDGFYYSDHRTVDSKNNVIVNVHVEPANINDVTPLPEILNEIEERIGTLPVYMGLDAGYHNAATAHLLESRGIQGVIGYRRHTHAGEHFGKWRFRYDSYGARRHGKATVNTSATQKNVQFVPKEANALDFRRREGWWSGMFGRMRWTKRTILLRRRLANKSTNGGRRPSSDHLRRPNKIMACALLACLVSQTCASSASSSLPFRT